MNNDFLGRWSRRKRMANAAAPPEAPSSAAHEAKNGSVPPSSKSALDLVEDFDLSTLPPLESISATTDVTAFLRKGVPPALSREALRRAWIADPTIRDFIGLAENAWDFNDPDAMPGFGPLDYTPEELRGLVARIVGGVQQAADDIAGLVAPPPGTGSTLSMPADRDQLQGEADMPAKAVGQIACEAERSEPEHVATQDAESDPRARQFPVVRRTHGGALPR